MANSIYEKTISTDLSPGLRPEGVSVEQLLERSANGDLDAATQVLSYLTASLFDLRQIMAKAIHSFIRPDLWRCLLTYLAVGEWGEWDPFGDSESTRRRRMSWKEPQSGSAGQVITELFVVDQNEAERDRKGIILARALYGPGPIRCAAAYLLGLRGDPKAIPILEDMICNETDPAVVVSEAWQLRAIEALASIGDPRCGPALLCGLTSSHSSIHRASARALHDLGSAAQDVLLLALLHPDSHIRWHAARALSYIGDIRAIDQLVAGLRDENQAVRWATASTIAGLDMPAIPHVLRLMIKHPLDERFRQSVYHAFHAMRSQNAKSYLRPMLIALRDPTAAYETPVIAQKLIMEWKPDSQVKDSVIEGKN